MHQVTHQVLPGVTIRRLDSYSLPLAAPITQGGRIFSAAGEVAQLVNGEPFRFLAYLEFRHAPEVVRGNHYHLRKYETLYVLQGSLHAWYQDIDSGAQAEHVVHAGDLIAVQPRCAHAYAPLAYTQAVEFAPTPFDSNDTYHHLLYAPADQPAARHP
jgi:quercetin dioxygenase-like cupin family protein